MMPALLTLPLLSHFRWKLFRRVTVAMEHEHVR